MQRKTMIKIIFKCVAFAFLAFSCSLIGVMVVVYGLNRQQETDGWSRWRSGSQSALGAIAGRLEERRSKIGPVPLDFVDYIREEISNDSRLRETTSSMYSEVKPLRASNQQGWCLVGRLFVRKCIRNLKDDDVIAISAPGKEFVEAPIYYLTLNSTLRQLDAYHDPDAASRFFESIGGKHIWDDN